MLAGSLAGAAAPAAAQTSTVPGAVTNAATTPGDGSLTVTWDPPTDDGGSPITGYIMQYCIHHAPDGLCLDNPTSVEFEADVTEYKITSLTNGTEYKVRLFAENAVDIGPWIEVFGTPEVQPVTVPGKVADPTITPGDGSLSVLWVAPDNGGSAITGYLLQHCEPDVMDRAQCAGNVDTVTLGNVTYHGLTGLANGTEHMVRVGAANSEGYGPYSDWVYAIPTRVYVRFIQFENLRGYGRMSVCI